MIEPAIIGVPVKIPKPAIIKIGCNTLRDVSALKNVIILFLFLLISQTLD